MSFKDTKIQVGFGLFENIASQFAYDMIAIECKDISVNGRKDLP